MTITVGTYLPPWGTDRSRTLGYDEDALTLAVEAGRRAIGAGSSATRVVFVSRDFPLLEGGNAAVLVAGLGLPNDTEVVERLGGAPETLDALITATAGTLVIGAEAEGAAGAAAALIADENLLSLAGRAQRSFPQRTRLVTGAVYRDENPRMLRELGIQASLKEAALAAKPLLIAGLRAKESAGLVVGKAPDLPTLGAASPLFAIAGLIETGGKGIIGACEQGTFVAANFAGGKAVVNRNEPQAQALPKRKLMPGGEIRIALGAYARAFEAKVRWQAGRCKKCGKLAMPPRFHCLGCGADDSWEYTALPRAGKVYTTTTIQVPVPSLASPYSLAVVELDGTDVRVLVHVTDSVPGSVKIDDVGRFVLRRVAMRTGVPDYGYAFSPVSGNPGGSK
ncbi:MAG: OB-fold domain-containing protein [Rhizobium sp.]